MPEEINIWEDLSGKTLSELHKIRKHAKLHYCMASGRYAEAFSSRSQYHDRLTEIEAAIREVEAGGVQLEFDFERAGTL